MRRGSPGACQSLAAGQRVLDGLVVQPPKHLSSHLMPAWPEYPQQHRNVSELHACQKHSEQAYALCSGIDKHHNCSSCVCVSKLDETFKHIHTA